MEAKSLGQIAYDAFWEHQEWMTDQGMPVVSWESAASGLKAAWEASGKAVARAVHASPPAPEVSSNG